MIPETETIEDDELAKTCARRNASPDHQAQAEAAFRILYQRHAKRLIAFLGGRVNASAIDDVHQIVWTKVWQAADRYQGGNFRAWVHQIARNVVVDHLRKRRHDPLPDGNELVDHREREGAPSAETERRDALARCLQKLERANSTVAALVRSRVAGESYDSICARTGMPADKAYRTFHQAKAQLQACVERTP